MPRHERSRRPRSGFSRRGRRIADEVAAPNADDVDRQARFPVETIDALREERALSAFVPVELGGAGGLVRGDRRGVLRARPPLRCKRDGVRDAPDPGGHDRAPPRGRRLVRGLPTRPRRGTAPDRLGDLRGGHRRRHGPLDRRRHARRRGWLHVREAGADRQLRRVRRRPAHDAAPSPGRGAGRPGPCSVAQRPARARADRHLGPAGHARHVLARLRRARGVPAEQVLPTPFPRVSVESMVPTSHILWSHLWLGIATDAFDRARPSCAPPPSRSRASRRRPPSACRT